MKKIQRLAAARFVAALLLAAVIAAACSDNDLLKASQGINDIALATAAMRVTAISANQDKLISDDDTRIVLTFIRKVNTAGMQASDITRKLTRLAPEDRTNLVQIIAPIEAALLDTKGPVAAIKDLKTRDAITGGILTVQTTVTTMRLLLNKGGPK